jgi:hypothetical protein
MDGAANMSFAEYLTISITSVWYLFSRYPEHFTSPRAFNAYLNFATAWRLNSVEAIFRDCFDHFPLSDEAVNELETTRRQRGRQMRFKMRSRCPWHWPVPIFDSSRVPYLPERRPHPDKYTFLLAMEYAHKHRSVGFAQEVWLRRQAWREQLEVEAINEFYTSRWDASNDKNMIRHEYNVVRRKVLRFRQDSWAQSSAADYEWSKGASDGLYEGYVRLLYVQTLAAGRQFGTAYNIILEGTGEENPWTQKVLSKVRNHAQRHGAKELRDYIDSLHYTLEGDVEEKAEEWWEGEEQEQTKEER